MKLDKDELKVMLMLAGWLAVMALGFLLTL